MISGKREKKFLVEENLENLQAHRYRRQENTLMNIKSFSIARNKRRRQQSLDNETLLSAVNEKFTTYERFANS